MLQPAREVPDSIPEFLDPVWEPPGPARELPDPVRELPDTAWELPNPAQELSDPVQVAPGYCPGPSGCRLGSFWCLGSMR